MFGEKDAPYLLLVLVSALGWLVTTISNNLTSVPTLTYHTELEEADGAKHFQIFISNISRSVSVTIEKLDLDSDGAEVAKMAPCLKVINVSPHFVADGSIPILSSGAAGTCILPLSVEDITLAPGARLGLQAILKGDGTLMPFLVKAKADEKENVRFINGRSVEAIIANNLVELYLCLFGVAFLGVLILLFIRRQNEGGTA